VGDLSDLRPLRAGEEMSELEINIRAAHMEQSAESTLGDDDFNVGTDYYVYD
jgi:hypothetical protein